MLTSFPRSVYASFLQFHSVQECEDKKTYEESHIDLNDFKKKYELNSPPPSLWKVLIFLSE